MKFSNEGNLRGFVEGGKRGGIDEEDEGSYCYCRGYWEDEMALMIGVNAIVEREKWEVGSNSSLMFKISNVGSIVKQFN